MKTILQKRFNYLDVIAIGMATLAINKEMYLAAIFVALVSALIITTLQIKYTPTKTDKQDTV